LCILTVSVLETECDGKNHRIKNIGILLVSPNSHAIFYTLSTLEVVQTLGLHDSQQFGPVQSSPESRSSEIREAPVARQLSKHIPATMNTVLYIRSSRSYTRILTVDGGRGPAAIYWTELKSLLEVVPKGQVFEDIVGLKTECAVVIWRVCRIMKVL
jgi:hypothetical protein